MSKLAFVFLVVARELSMIRSFNINPSLAKEYYDVSEQFEMLGNGKYLANTIYSILKNTSNKEELDAVLGQLFDGYDSIKVETTNDYKRCFSLLYKDKSKFAANKLSDGTVKLIALLVGIIRHKEQMIIIEEPENYLHPKANRLLIDYLRDIFKESACILTSHSETILNLIEPQELLLCNLNKRFTSCCRLHDIDKIKNMIEESGFGAGYHYVVGNIGGDCEHQ
jgi:predicted ATPase